MKLMTEQHLFRLWLNSAFDRMTRAAMEHDAGTVSMLLDSDENATKSVCIRMPMCNCQCISILLVSVGALFILKSSMLESRS